MYQETYPHAYLTVKRSTAGRGLFATKNICQGSFIIEYTGELITTKEAERRGGKYLFKINKRWVVDGKGKENLSRYINHSCRPNCEAQIKGNQILIYALRPIRKGEELGYDYGDEYFKDYIEPQGCKCMHCLAMAKLIV